MTLAQSAGGHPPNRPFLVWGFHTHRVRSINGKNLLELALEGLDNKTNVSGMLSSFRLYTSVAPPLIYQEHDPTLESGVSHNSMHDVDDRP